MSLRPFGSVYRAALLSVLDALRVEHAAQDVVAHAREILDAAAANEHDRMLLQIMALARDVAHHLIAVGETNLGHFAKLLVRLLRRRRVNAGADTPLLRTIGERRDLVALGLLAARFADQLIHRWHSCSSISLAVWPDLQKNKQTVRSNP